MRIDGRAKLPTTEFCLEDRLYRAYYLEELDDSGEIDVETLRFPDLGDLRGKQLPVHFKHKFTHKVVIKSPPHKQNLYPLSS